jgi:DNA-binding XRE family transcriptional regulator
VRHLTHPEAYHETCLEWFAVGFAVPKSSLQRVNAREFADDPGNNLRQVREARMLSKAELARQAGISPLTIDRIEKGMPCRIATRRKILLALALKLSQWRRVFREK